MDARPYRMSNRRPDPSDYTIFKLSARERTTIIDPKETRARQRRRMAGVLLAGLCGLGVVKRDLLMEKVFGRKAVAAVTTKVLPAKSMPVEIKVRKSASERKAAERELQAATRRKEEEMAARQQAKDRDKAEEAALRAKAEESISLGSLNLVASAYPADRHWPATVSLAAAPEIETVDDENSATLFVYRSPYYEFRSDTKLGADVVREFARVFEATHMAVCRLPLDLRPSPEPLRKRFTAQLFKGEKEYREAGGMAGSAGCYKHDQKCILVPLSSLGVKVLDGGHTVLDRGGAANATLIHEITHQLMNHWLPRLPIWYTEGAAEYMVVPEYLHGRFNFTQLDGQLRQYLNRRGSREITFSMLRPAELMAMEPAEWAQTLAKDIQRARENYVSAMLLAFFFHHLDGRGEGIAAYLRAIEEGKSEIQACRDHLIRGRTFEAIEGEIRRTYLQLGVKISPLSRGGREFRPLGSFLRGSE